MLQLGSGQNDIQHQWPPFIALIEKKKKKKIKNANEYRKRRVLTGRSNNNCYLQRLIEFGVISSHHLREGLPACECALACIQRIRKEWDSHTVIIYREFVLLTSDKTTVVWIIILHLIYKLILKLDSMRG